MIFYFIYISRVYRVQVTLKGKENLFQSPGGHTFLIPVDEGFKVSKTFHNIFNKIDMPYKSTDIFRTTILPIAEI